MTKYAVTKTWDDRPWEGMMRLPMHETFEVSDLAEVGAGIAWTHGKYSAWGNNGGFGPKLITYIARPLNG